MELSELQIQGQILAYLRRLPNSLVWVNNQSGKPVKRGGKTIMVPFSNTTRGMSDVMALINGVLFAFEVKTVKAYGHVKRGIPKWSEISPLKLNKQQRHLMEQHRFLIQIRMCGGAGDFVCDIEQVQELIDLVEIGDDIPLGVD